VHIWDAASGEELQVIELPEGITGNIYDYGLTVKWSPDGEHLLTISGDRFLLGSQDYDLMLWEVSPSGKGEAATKPVLTIEIANEAEPEEGEGIITTFGVHYATGAAADFAPQSGRLVTVGGDNTAIIWDASLMEQELVLKGHENDVSAVDWSPDDTRLATASEDGTARIWDAHTGEMLQVLEGHEGAVNSVAWSPDGAQLATAGDDGTVRFWDGTSHDEGKATGELQGTIEPQAGVVSTLAWSPDGSYLATGTDDGRVRIWRISQGDATSGEVIAELGGHIDFIAHLAWSPIDDRLVSAGADGVTRVLNAAPSTAEQTLPFIGVSDLSWSYDGSHLALPVAFGEPSPGTVAIWDVAADQLVTDELDAGYGYYWFEADYSPDDRLLQIRGISSYPEGIADAEIIHVVDVLTGQEVKSFSATEGSWLRAKPGHGMVRRWPGAQSMGPCMSGTFRLANC
jgi:WD40 repeat protein